MVGGLRPGVFSSWVLRAALATIAIAGCGGRSELGVSGQEERDAGSEAHDASLVDRFEGEPAPPHDARAEDRASPVDVEPRDRPMPSTDGDAPFDATRDAPSETREAQVDAARDA